MKNQQIRKEISDNNLPTEIPPAQRVYAFKDLPNDVREKLLQMQKTDGDFLRTDDKTSILANMIWLFSFVFIFESYLSSLDLSSLNLVKAIVFGVISVPFIYWIAYFGRAVYRTFTLPVKDHVYLTRTQIVETKDGAVRFFDLKDVVKIELDKVPNQAGSGGWDYILNFQFADGFYIGCGFPRWWKEHYAEAEQWREKSGIWRDEAADAFRRGDTAFFSANNIISKSAMVNLPVLKQSSRFLFVSPRLMFKITFVMILVGIVAYIVFKLTGLAK
ncbi:MAG: hypothetical protein ACR2HG_11145 [Pyrinomonadaceae bacterium]